MVTTEHFGTTEDGHDFSLFTLEAAGITAKVSDFGAVLVSILAPDAAGRLADCVLGFDDGADYLTNKDFFGALAGPIANRTAGAELELGGRTYHLVKNEGENNNHTDFDRGLHKQLWDVVEVGESSVTFGIDLADGVYGLPGNRHFTVTYEVTSDARVRVHIHATTDAETCINATSHTYFNIAGAGKGVHDVLDQELQVWGSHFIPVGPGSIPTGEVRPVAGTPFDFTAGKPIGCDLAADDEQLKMCGGYDHAFCVDGYDGKGTVAHALRICDPASGRVMDVWTTQPGVQTYTGNYLGGLTGHDGAVYEPRDGIAFEAQYYADSPHHADFPQDIFGPERDFDSVIEFAFSVQ